MADSNKPNVCVVDYGLGNLFSVRHACSKVGLQAEITSAQEDILRAEAVILPGVGSFGDAMKTLNKLGLIETLQEVALSSIPFLGICLGMQLLMTESYEFGHHLGLGIIPGSVRRFEDPVDRSGNRLKVPHVGWNRIYEPIDNSGGENKWKNSLLDGLDSGEFMYFVHSYYVNPEDQTLTLSTSRYGNIDFCSTLEYKNIFACQFHPERSGPEGLRIYENLFISITAGNRGDDDAGTAGE